jgi:soluble lytic murein transglycosylase-like protein
MSSGRGAWTPIGKDNGSALYEYLPGKPMDGASPGLDVNHQGVHLGVQAIQIRLNKVGYRSTTGKQLVVDGVFGPASAAAVRWLQSSLQVKETGRVGTSLARVLFLPVAQAAERRHSIPSRLLCGLMLKESTADPGAVGSDVTDDKGLLQFNTKANKNISVEWMFDPERACDMAGERLAKALLKYRGKSTDLQHLCAVAQHNSPVRADYWWDTGKPPNQQIEKYARDVLFYAGQV